MLAGKFLHTQSLTTVSGTHFQFPCSFTYPVIDNCFGNTLPISLLLSRVRLKCLKHHAQIWCVPFGNAPSQFAVGSFSGPFRVQTPAKALFSWDGLPLWHILAVGMGPFEPSAGARLGLAWRPSTRCLDGDRSMELRADGKDEGPKRESTNQRCPQIGLKKAAAFSEVMCLVEKENQPLPGVPHNPFPLIVNADPSPPLPGDNTYLLIGYFGVDRISSSVLVQMSSPPSRTRKNTSKQQFSKYQI